jgi:hypothetical protein
MTKAIIYKDPQHYLALLHARLSGKVIDVPYYEYLEKGKLDFLSINEELGLSGLYTKQSINSGTAYRFEPFHNGGGFMTTLYKERED